MKLLIIEDEMNLLASLKKRFAVDIADDGNQGSYLAEINDYDVIIIDLNLPYKDGIEILREIRLRSNIQKVIILSARSSILDKIHGFDNGANDYLAKPFDFLEFEARVRNLIRRDFVQKESTINIKNIMLDTNARMIIHNNETIELAPKEYAILEYLAFNKGTVISSEKLVEHVWDSEVDLFQVSVKVHISTLRKKLRLVCGDQIIKTVRGTGYLIEEG